MLTVDFWKDAGTRAVKTIAQTALSMLTMGQAVADINWINVVSVSAVAGLISLLMSIGREATGNDDNNMEG